jgi:hypothetical protein
MPTHERLGPHDRENPEDCWKPTIQLDKEPSVIVVSRTRPCSLRLKMIN